MNYIYLNRRFYSCMNALWLPQPCVDHSALFIHNSFERQMLHNIAISIAGLLSFYFVSALVFVFFQTIVT